MRAEGRRIALAFLIVAAAISLGANAFRVTARPIAVSAARLEAIADRPVGLWRPREAGSDVINASPLNSDGELVEAYDHVVYRSYQRPDGTAIVLVLGYVNQQQVRAGLHRPEGCYTSLGFAMTDARATTTDVAGRPILINSFVATNATREEHVAYWMRVGGTVSRSPIAVRMESLRQLASHHVPDGIIVRASISRPAGSESLSPGSDAMLRTFLADFVAAMPQADRALLVG